VGLLTWCVAGGLGGVRWVVTAKWPEVCRQIAHCGRSRAGGDLSLLGVHRLLEGRGDAIGFFDAPMADTVTQARALLLALLRDRRPGDEASAVLAEAAGSYLRLNPDDAEVREAWGRFTGRPATAGRCAHNGFLLVEPAEAGYAVRCVLCGTVGPVRKAAEAARKALLVLGAGHRG